MNLPDSVFEDKRNFYKWFCTTPEITHTVLGSHTLFLDPDYSRSLFLFSSSLLELSVLYSKTAISYFGGAQVRALLTISLNVNFKTPCKTIEPKRTEGKLVTRRLQNERYVRETFCLLLSESNRGGGAGDAYLSIIPSTRLWEKWPRNVHSLCNKEGEPRPCHEHQRALPNLEYKPAGQVGKCTRH